ncbi:MAG TPA: nitroreductase/quinone reductase family protein [Candidatus Limnocylindrales bacterium]
MPGGTSTTPRNVPPALPLPARRSAAWNIGFRVFYRGLRLMDPMIQSWLAAGSPGLDGVIQLRYVGRRSGLLRQTLVTLLTVGDQWYVGHPNGSAGWVRNIEAAGVVDIVPAGARGSRFAVLRLAPGPERDGVIRATWTQQPFPGRLVYRAARRHVAAVGVYHRLEPIPADTEGTPAASPQGAQ